MSTTLTVQNSINFIQPILKNQGLLVSDFEPAMTAANMVLGLLTGPPMKWPFNRGTFTGSLTPASTDVAIAIADYGHMAGEHAWLLDGSGSTHRLDIRTGLSIENAPGRPTELSIQNDDNAGNITFRGNRTPDVNYTLNGFYQRKPPLLDSPGRTWLPISDQFGYIYNWGFLAIASLLVNDSRFPIFEQYFLSRALGAQTGLTDQERNIFVGTFLAMTGTLSRGAQRDQLGTAALAR